MTAELNWCGQPIGDGGREEWIPKTWAKTPATKQHHCIVTESHLVEVFGHGAYKLTRAEAAKRLGLLTGTHRTSCYRALRLKGRFERHLHADGRMLSWR